MSRKALGKVVAAAAAVLVAGGVVPLAARADRPPATADGAVTRAAAALAGKPKATLDVVVTLDEVADSGLRSRLDKVATWSWAFRNLPLAGVRLPAARLDSLRRVDGVKGVYLNTPLRYELKDSAKAMNVGHAWNDLHMTGKGVTVAILDSGVDFTHPDLAPAMKANVKLLELGAPTPTVPIEGVPNSDTTSGHGTHVAGDVAGRGIKSNGDYKGMAPDASLVGIGAGEGLNIFTAAEGFDWIIANRTKYGIRVINNSWGSDFAPFDPNAPLNIATKKLADAGVVVLFAMGNSYDEMTMNPQASAPWVIPVAAGTKTGGVVDFTSGGIEADVLGTGFDKEKVDGDARVAGKSLGLYHPAVTSTGENVISTRANNTVVPLSGAPSDITDMPPDRIPYYTTLSGTSMATPETAGVVADILQANPALTPPQVRSVLEVTARPIDGVPFYKQGYGYTDASAAVELALGLAGKPASFVQQTLDTKHAARDATILGEVNRPAHTAAWNDETEPGPVSVDHTTSVPAGTARFKVVANGPSSPELNVVAWDITVTDAKGAQVGATTNFPIGNLNSGTVVLDLDLHKLSPDPATAAKLFNQLNWGSWTVSVSSPDSMGSHSLNAEPLVSQFTLAKSNLSIVAAAFDAPPVNCLPVPTFVPAAPKTYRIQDDTSSGTPYPGDPSYTYVGPLASGSLANRTPPRNLVAAFNEFTTEVPFSPPRFTTPKLTAPLTIGTAAVVETWVQGPSATLGAGDLEAAVLDISPDDSAKTITSTGGVIEVHSDPSAPVQTKAVIPLAKGYTIAAGHRLGLDLGVLHSQNTVADQLFYDSDTYPTSLTIVPGSIQNISACGVPGAAAASPATGGKVLGSQQTRPATASGLPPTGRNSPVVLAFALVLLAMVVRRATRQDRSL